MELCSSPKRKNKGIDPESAPGAIAQGVASDGSSQYQWGVDYMDYNWPRFYNMMLTFWSFDGFFPMVFPWFFPVLPSSPVLCPLLATAAFDFQEPQRLGNGWGPKVPSEPQPQWSMGPSEIFGTLRKMMHIYIYTYRYRYYIYALYYYYIYTISIYHLLPK